MTANRLYYLQDYSWRMLATALVLASAFCAGCQSEDEPLTVAKSRYAADGAADNDAAGTDDATTTVTPPPLPSANQDSTTADAIAPDLKPPTVLNRPDGSTEVALHEPENNSNGNSEAAAPPTNDSTTTDDVAEGDAPDSLEGLSRKMSELLSSRPSVEMTFEQQQQYQQGIVTPELEQLFADAQQKHDDALADVLEKIVVAADGMLQRTDLEESDRVRANMSKFMSFGQLANLGQANSEEDLLALATSLQDDENAELATIARSTIFNKLVSDFAAGDEEITGEQIVGEANAILDSQAHTEHLFMALQSSLPILMRSGHHAEALEMLELIGTTFRDHDNPEVASGANSLLEQRTLLELQLHLRDVMDDKPDAEKKLISEMQKVVSVNPSLSTYRVISQIAQVLEQTGRYETCGSIYDMIQRGFATVENPQFRQMVDETVASAKKRLNLIGTQMEITGVPVDGSSFDWKSYRGKYVLIDFWATWCKPCRDELPNLQANYEKYKAKGFEVVGVNVDDDTTSVASFLADNPLPWPTLRAEPGQPQGLSNPVAVACGVEGIPFIMLYDPDGKIIDLHLRGERLGERLEELLGDGASDAGGDPIGDEDLPATEAE